MSGSLVEGDPQDKGDECVSPLCKDVCIYIYVYIYDIYIYIIYIYIYMYIFM